MKTVLKQILAAISAIVLLSAMVLSLSSCYSIRAENLMKNVPANTVSGNPADEKFIKSTANFSIELFKKSQTKNKNSLISPLSVMTALTMTANGAANQTLSQMEKVLGQGIPLAQLNEYEYNYGKNLPNEEKSKFKIANSIWFRNTLNVYPDFLQKNADYFHAAAYKSAFDDKTVTDINNWVKKNTDGKIKNMVDKISDDTVMYLFNAVTFDAEWKEVYEKNNISKHDFTAIDGTVQTVDFMKSDESRYLDDGMATGFIKPYYNNKYSFVALLPNEDISIETFIGLLTGEKFLNIIKNAEQSSFDAYLPKFTYEYTITMNDALKAMGMPDAFSENADLSEIAKEGLFINEVLHKTFISIDERGTKAGAVSKEAIANSMSEKTVKLNRPFVYAIVDNSTNLPVFIGTVMSVK